MAIAKNIKSFGDFSSSPSWILGESFPPSEKLLPSSSLLLSFLEFRIRKLDSSSSFHPYANPPPTTPEFPNKAEEETTWKRPLFYTWRRRFRISIATSSSSFFVGNRRCGGPPLSRIYRDANKVPSLPRYLGTGLTCGSGQTNFTQKTHVVLSRNPGITQCMTCVINNTILY